MKKIILYTFLGFSFWSYSQVGVNTTEPHAQLDIRSSSQANPTNTDGLLIPKIDNFPGVNPGVDQNGMMVFLTTTVGSNAPGFYYWEAVSNTWVPVKGSDGGTLDQAYNFGGAGAGNTIIADAGAVTIAGTDGLVSTGTLGTGALSPSGEGVRMVWNPGKAAFRAGGIIFGTQWNNVNIGDYSTAFGLNTTASGAGSFAFGDNSRASGSSSTAFGLGTTASAFGSTAFGLGNTASANLSTAFGGTTTASGIISTAFGNSTTASGFASTSYGIQNTASSYAETVIGIGATNYTISANGATQFRTANATDRLFVIGNAIDTNNNGTVDDTERSDAMIVLKNGLTRLPSMDNAMIDAGDGKTVVIKEYLQSNIVWSTIGNTATNAATNFIGTTDLNDFSIRTNNTQQAVVTSAGKTIFGNSVPTGDAWANFSKVIVGTNDNDNDITLRASGNDIPAINIIRSQGTMSTPLVFDSGEVGSLRFWNYTNSGPFAGYSAAGRVASIADSEGTSLLLSGAATSSHLVIRDTGQIGIGILNPQERLHVVGNIRMVDGNQALGSVLTSDANGTASWQTLSAPSLNGWSTLGNTGLNATTNFIGTTNAVDVIFRRNNIRAGRLGVNNTSFGVDALSAAGTGIFNTAVGSASLQNFTNGSRNVAVGSVSLNANTTGDNNTALGVDALSFNETGNNNTAVGRRAMGSTGALTSGSNNTALGYFAYSTGNFTNSTALGANTVITASNQIRVGNNTVTSIGGTVGFTNLSDRRFKKNIQYDAPGLAFIKKLRPATYQLDMENMARFLGTPEESRDRNAERIRENTPETGFIAQEVEQAAREVGFVFSGVDVPQSNSDYYGLRYASFVVPLVKAVQEQQQIIETQKEEITQLQEQYRLLLQRVERLEQQ